MAESQVSVTFRPIAVLLAITTLVPSNLLSQQPPGVPVTAPNSGRSSPGLRVVILEGHEVTNSLASRSAVSPVVEVRDAMENLIEGAEVEFVAPPSGPGGVFENGTNIIKVRTDYRGQAAARFTPNTLPGAFNIVATATFQGQTAQAVLRQRNDSSAVLAAPDPPSSPWYKDWRWWAVIGGAAAGGAFGYYYGFRSSPDPVIRITPGVIAIGGPR